ncbi:phage virion morphogenesis protein [Microvirga terricola]|uniref:Phage virion morphogenesis protein n=1 Tax=Microvirga terricola TaxID=2719797 RepID=A0ABX0V868_9HYPH|nr:phage virion morphogenesis protein [Microvirga terricola]NIX75394.1 phage virion morphogenesis protein [Microvirga terricola]
MTGITLETKIDAKAAIVAFRKVQRRVADMTPLMRAIGTGLVENTHTRFERAQDPQGRAWKPVSPTYALGKRGPGILRESAMRGGLMGSITFRASAQSVAVGSNKVYAAVHQLGGTISAKGSHLVFPMGNRMVFAKSVTIPARPFLGIGREDEETILEVLETALDPDKGL